MAVVCLLLTLWSAVAFAAHHHSDRTEAAKCTVCMAAHSAAAKTAVSLLKAKFIPIHTRAISDATYGIVVLLSFVTTLFAPPVFRRQPGYRFAIEYVMPPNA